MILLTPGPSVTRSGRRSAVAIFGAGTIGAAVADSLVESAGLIASTLDLEWTRFDVFSAHLAAIETRMSMVLEGDAASLPPDAFHVIWSAGRAGFFSTDQEVARELEMFDDVLRSVERLADRFPKIPFTMVLTSSAGGLFEGQQGVDNDTPPVPTRPYGRLKLQQEQLLLASKAHLTKKIYRLTSVYGYIRSDQRRGLIATLIANGLRQQASQITGHSSTVRDFIWIEDVADYIACGVLEPLGDDCVAVLASTKPSSILEIQRIVESTIGRPLYLCFLPQATNAAPITFHPSSVPDDWRPSELSTNVRKIAADALARQTVFLESR